MTATDTKSTHDEVTISRHALRNAADALERALLSDTHRRAARTRTHPEEQPAMLTLVVADDHAVVRRGLRALLEVSLTCTIVGEAATGQEAIALTECLRPDVLIVDLVMPELGGLEVIRRVHAAVPATRIVVVSMYANDAHVRQALRDGALAIVAKEAPAEAFILGVQAAAAGRRYLSPPLSERAIAAYAARVDPYDTLTAREREVVLLAAQGYPNAAIAERLVLSPRTVETYRATVMRKLALPNQTALVIFALQRGLIVLPDA